MSQVKSLFSENKKSVYIAAFLTPILILGIIMICSQVYPLGEYCILKTDMYHQYAPFFSEFRNKLQTGGSLNYTWNLGLGVNFVAIMAYYLASPTNWLIALVGKNYVIEFMSVTILVKAGLSAVSMTYYLRDKADDEYFGPYIFGLFYALCGYFCAYYWNVMWLDTIAVFPIVVLGAEKIIKGKSGILYSAALGYSIFCNYYISIMVCIFLVFYFFMYSVVEGYENFGAFIKTGIRFGIYSLLAGGLAAVFLLPEIYALGYTASSESTFPKTFTQYFSMIDMLARHMGGVETEQWHQHYPNIYCGTAVYMLFVLYYKSKKISLKEKAAYIVMAIFMLVGFSVNILNYIWHGLRFPNSLPGRQAFIYSFLILVMCFRVYQNRMSISRKDIGTALGISLAFILIAQHVVKNDQLHFVIFYIAMLITALYALVMHLYRDGRLKEKAAAIAVFVIAIAELSANTAYTSMSTTSRTAYLANNDEIRELLSEADDGSFYRVERVSRKTKDDGAWLNFPAVSIFSSMANADCTKFFKRIGCEGSTNAYSITGSTPFADMLFGVKYAIYASEQTELQGMRLVDAKGDAYLYQNDYSLPLGFIMPAGMSQNWMLELTDPVLVQNSFCDQLGVGQLLKPVLTGNESSGKYAVTLSEDGEYYAFISNSKAETVTVNWPDKKKVFEHLDRKYLIELGQCHKGDLIKLSSDEGKNMDVKLYRFDYGVLGDIYDKLSVGGMTVTEFGDDFVKATVEVDPSEMGYISEKAQILITTPYDEGWKVTVDGEPVTLYKGLDAFVSFYLTSGKHEIEMHYEPRGLMKGLAISIVSAMLLISIAVYGIYKKKKANNKIENIQISEEKDT